MPGRKNLRIFISNQSCLGDVQDKDTVTIEGEQEAVFALSNGDIDTFNDPNYLKLSLLVKLWVVLPVFAMSEARRFKFGLQIDHGEHAHARLLQMGCAWGHKPPVSFHKCVVISWKWYKITIQLQWKTIWPVELAPISMTLSDLEAV